MRTIDGKREWLIAWEGHDERGRGWDDSWEPTCNVSEDLATKLQVAQDNIGFAGGCLRSRRRCPVQITTTFSMSDVEDMQKHGQTLTADVVLGLGKGWVGAGHRLTREAQTTLIASAIQWVAEMLDGRRPAPSELTRDGNVLFRGASTRWTRFTQRPSSFADWL